MHRDIINDSKRIIVKVGTRVLTYSNGKLNLKFIERLVRQIADLQNQGKEIILVSSGAVGAGMGRLGIKKKPTSIPEKQAVAAVGQGYLIQIYEKLFAEYGHTVAQILLTREDLRNRNRYLNSRNTMLSLLKYGVIPIINENDTVAVEEIEFGDNDTLSALVASLSEADLLIILSTIDGLYTKDPNTNSDAKFISYIPELTKEILSSATNTTESLGTGGMITKLQAADIAVDSGINVIIANGKKENILYSILAGEETGTLIVAKETGLPLRKRWLAYGPVSQGLIVVDKGAKQAIVKDGKSLLPSGIVSIQESFGRGEMVKIEDVDGNFIGRGLTNYSSEELDKIKGLKSNDVKNVLKCPAETEVVHRDKLVVNSKLL